MARAATVAKGARRQHFIARFYLRNFAEPVFSDNLCVYDMRKRRWEKRTPGGVGWFPHLCSMIDIQGNRSDDFDPALKRLATGGALDANERAAVALFVALTAARSPELMNSMMTEHLGNLGAGDRAELDALVKRWCEWTGKPYSPKSHSEFLKPSSFGWIWISSQSLQRRLLQWEWHLVHTTRDRPFVTSDWPVFGQRVREHDVRLVSFPVSSEVALIVIGGAQFDEVGDHRNEAYAMNRRTMDRASEFVVACKESFPADDYLTRLAERR